MVKISSIGSVIVLALILPRIAAGDESSKALAAELVQTNGIKIGLCVHLGCRDGALTAELAGSGNFLVHGLDKDPAMIEKARRNLLARGLNGRVMVEETSWQQPLPYPDNTINLIIADDLPALLGDGLSLSEVARVLAPRGVACIGKSARGKVPSPAEFKTLLANAGLKDFELVKVPGTWARIRKPLNPRADEYTHAMYDAGMNIVSGDDLACPEGATQLRWLNTPPTYYDSEWPIISAHGVVLYGHLEWAPEGKQHRGVLEARDAYNGYLLWRKTVNFYSPRNMAAAGDRLYLYLPTGEEDKRAGRDILTAVNINTGESIFTVPRDVLPVENWQGTCLGSVSTTNGVILVTSRRRAPLDVHVIDAATQKLLWKKSGIIGEVAGEGLAYLSNADTLTAYDLKTGEEKWKLAFDGVPNLEVQTKPDHASPEWARLSLHQYAYGKLILFNGLKDGTQVYAVSAKDGKYMWDYKYTPAFGLVPLSYPNEIWLTTKGGGRGDGYQVSLDPYTGKEKRRYPGLIPTSCGPPRGAKNYILGTPKGSCGFLDLATLKVIHVGNFCRTCCQGQIPANGLQYFIPHGCICSGSLVRGFYATGADETPLAISKDQPHPLIKGSVEVPAAGAGSNADWPMCRRDARRSNTTATEGPAELKKLWEGKVGDGLVSPVTVAGGLAFASDVEGLQVCAFNAATGAEKWRYLAGCRVDVPPAVVNGLCAFGGRDGWVYCLNAQTGQLVWKYRAAPADRRIVINGRMESPWPVVGGVMVQSNLVYVCAGRTTGVNGGIYLHAIEPATGKCVQTANVKEHVCLAADWLVGDGTNVYVHAHKWMPNIADKEFRFRSEQQAPKGLLRTDTAQNIANIIWHLTPAPVESHRSGLICGGKERGEVFAFTDTASYAGGLGLLLWDRQATQEEAKTYNLAAAGSATWRKQLTVQFVALIKAGKTLYGAGVPPDRDPTKKGELWAVSAEDGKVLATVPLDAWPAPDGLAAAGGRLYAALQNGKIQCFGK